MCRFVILSHCAKAHSQEWLCHKAVGLGLVGPEDFELFFDVGGSGEN